MRKWIFLTSIVACLFLETARAQSQEPDIAQFIAAVNQDSLVRWVYCLSGETSIHIGGQEQTIWSRNKHYPGNDLAADYIAWKLAGWGLEVENQWFSETGRNVLGFQTGRLYPDQRYILCAHYDSMPDSATAPGADDNASGVAAVLEAARILAGNALNFSVVFAFWDEEEYGYYGSSAYVSSANARHESIRGAINLDMIAWDSNSDLKMLFDVGNDGNQNPLYQTASGVNRLYDIGLHANTTTIRIESDQRSFRGWDYQALGIHEYFGDDMNEFYHSTEDRAVYFNQDYFHRCARLAVGTLASLAMSDILVTVEPESGIPANFSLAQNSPNPFNPITMISYSIQKAARVSIRVWDECGRQVSIVEDDWREPGDYSVSFDGNQLASGVYTYQIQANEFVQTRKMLLLK